MRPVDSYGAPRITNRIRGRRPGVFNAIFRASCPRRFHMPAATSRHAEDRPAIGAGLPRCGVDLCTRSRRKARCEVSRHDFRVVALGAGRLAKGASLAARSSQDDLHSRRSARYRAPKGSAIGQAGRLGRQVAFDLLGCSHRSGEAMRLFSAASGRRVDAGQCGWRTRRPMILGRLRDLEACSAPPSSGLPACGDAVSARRAE